MTGSQKCSTLELILSLATLHMNVEKLSIWVCKAAAQAVCFHAFKIHDPMYLCKQGLQACI